MEAIVFISFKYFRNTRDLPVCHMLFVSKVVICLPRLQRLSIHFETFEQTSLQWKNMLWEKVQCFRERKRDFFIPWKTRYRLRIIMVTAQLSFENNIIAFRKISKPPWTKQPALWNSDLFPRLAQLEQYIVENTIVKIDQPKTIANWPVNRMLHMADLRWPGDLWRSRILGLHF